MSAPPPYPPSENPDRRPLPGGWITQYDSKCVHRQSFIELNQLLIKLLCIIAIEPGKLIYSFVAEIRLKFVARFYVNTVANPPVTTWTHPLGPPPTSPPPNPYGSPPGPPPRNSEYGYNNPQGQYSGYGGPGYQPSPPPQPYYGNSPPPQGYGSGGYGGYREEENRGPCF